MAESTVSHGAVVPAPARPSIEELIRRAGTMLENALGSVDPESSWDQVREARHLLMQAERALELDCSAPDPKYGRIWSEKKSFRNEPVFPLRGQDRLAMPAVMFYVSLLAAVGGDTRGALSQARAMEDWPVKKYAD